ncbi:hypothetical protein R6Q57_004119 [Mikania cordata]
MPSLFKHHAPRLKLTLCAISIPYTFDNYGEIAPLHRYIWLKTQFLTFRIRLFNVIINPIFPFDFNPFQTTGMQPRPSEDLVDTNQELVNDDFDTNPYTNKHNTLTPPPKISISGNFEGKKL